MSRIEIYTDGSCQPNPGRGGWAFVAYQDGQEIHSQAGGETTATNNRMELTGVLRALQWAIKSRADGVTIISDSTYALNGVRKWADKGEVKPGTKNADLWERIVPAQKLCGAKLQWVRSHSGNDGNRRADKMAQRGRLRMQKSPSVGSGIETHRIIGYQAQDVVLYNHSNGVLNHGK